MESPRSRHSLEERVADLEQSVAELRALVADLREDDPSAASDDRSASKAPSSRSSSPSTGGGWSSWVQSRSSLSREDWLGRAGIVLLLVGLLFLFKYSVEQGWIGPTVRVGFGAGVGGVLLGVGLRTSPSRRRIRQVFLGGSIAAFYATAFAAYQLYGLVSFSDAFGGMIAVTLFTFVLALREDEALFGVIGTAGGLGTPFLLYADVGSVPGLVAYTSLILAGTGAIYLYRGWKTLLGTAVVGGWFVFLVACFDLGFAEASVFDRWVLQGGLFLTGGLFGGLPLLRALWEANEPPRPFWSIETHRRLQGLLLHLLVTSTPLLLIGGTKLLWSSLSSASWSGIGLAAAAIYAFLAVTLRRKQLPHYVSAHALTAAILTAYGLWEGFDGAALQLLFAVEAISLLELGRWIEKRSLRWAGHGLFVVLALWVMSRFLTPVDGSVPLTEPIVLSALGVLAFGLAASVRISHETLQWIYRLAVWGGWLGWGWYALHPLPFGHAYVSTLWGLTGLILLVGGAWWANLLVQYLAGATLCLFIGKLFFVDLAALPALWRILLFLGGGGAFLAFSYALPKLLPDRGSETQSVPR